MENKNKLILSKLISYYYMSIARVTYCYMGVAPFGMEIFYTQVQHVIIKSRSRFAACTLHGEQERLWKQYGRRRMRLYFLRRLTCDNVVRGDK